jgi:hypothetical protein
MDKWEELVIGPVQTMLGLVIDAYQLTVGIPTNYVNKVLLPLNNTWHCGRKQFTVTKAQKLTGKLGHLAQGTAWIFRLFSICMLLLRTLYLRSKDFFSSP